MDSLQHSIEWKTALHLPIVPHNLHASFLCKFRRWLIDNEVSKNEYQKLLNMITDLVLQGLNPLTIDVEQLIFDVCTFNISELAFATTTHLFETLTSTQPEWLHKNAPPQWRDRYLYDTSHYNVLFPTFQKNINLQEVLMDGQNLLSKLQLSGLEGVENLDEFTLLKRICKLGSLFVANSSTQVGTSNCDYCDLYPVP